MSPDTLPEGTDSIIDPALDASDIDLSGAVPMDNGAAADADAAGADFASTGAFDDGETFPLDAEAPAPVATGGAADAGGTAAIDPRETLRDAKEQAGQKAQDLKGQATDKLRSYAVGGKVKATETIQGFVRMIEDAAAQVDEKVGPQFGDYARQAAQRLSGVASTLEGKDVDELFDQGRDLVRKSPGIAIGAAAAIGFVVARLARSGVEAASAGPDRV